MLFGFTAGKEFKMQTSEVPHASDQIGLDGSQTAKPTRTNRQRVRESSHAHLHERAQEAMADRDFIADVRETMDAFGYVDRENWPPALGVENTSAECLDVPKRDADGQS